jgi:transposase InsO family protein
MPWKEKTVMSQKLEMVLLASREGANISAIARAFNVERSVVYRWRRQYQECGEEGRREAARRPSSSPERTSDELEQAILAVRDQHHWGARKIARRLRDQGVAELHKSTVHSVLRRHGKIDPAASAAHTPYIRFEHDKPNDLWQMDFKGWFKTGAGVCYPLTILDDHSRFSVCLAACNDQSMVTVQSELTRVFQRYGLPWRMTMDNGSPWGDQGGPSLTILTAWLVRLGVAVSHSRPYHPQTQGKDERFHRSLKAELLRWVTFRDNPDAQRHFDPWRNTYNLERPHEALDMAAPVTRYAPSPRTMPAELPPIEYGSDDLVRKVDAYGYIGFRGVKIRAGRACAGLHVALRPTTTEGQWDLYFCHHKLRRIDLNELSNTP